MVFAVVVVMDIVIVVMDIVIVIVVVVIPRTVKSWEYENLFLT